MNQSAAIADLGAIQAEFYELEVWQWQWQGVVAVWQHELQRNLHLFFMTHLQPSNVPPSNGVIDVPPSNDVICETTVEEEKVLSCSGCADTGIAWLAQCAREAMAEAAIASTLQEPATDPKNVVKAYKTVMTADPSSAKVARLLRDLLVLTVCTNDGPWTNTSLREKMNELFDEQVGEVSDNFMSKILHAYNTMHQAAQNLQAFNKAVRVFDQLCNEALENILAAYIVLYERTPTWTSNTKRNGRPNRHAKPSHAMKKQLAADLADLDEIAESSTHPKHRSLSTKAESSASLTP